MTDPISDMLTRIRNANRALLPQVAMPHSKLKESIVSVLKREGYVADYTVDGATVAKTIKIKLKYTGRKSVIEGLTRVSRPGLRRYAGATEVPRVLGGLGITILSTSEGIMTATQARKKNVGGEMLCKVW
jgi:small subunit ribosomal protein S8